VKTALNKVDPEETLIIVTADHSHVFTIAGYPTRGNPILGKVVGNDSRGEPRGEFARAADGMPYPTLGYTNGRGFAMLETGGDTRYREPVAAGRVADLQNVIYHVMARATRLSGLDGEHREARHQRDGKSRN